MTSTNICSVGHGRIIFGVLVKLIWRSCNLTLGPNNYNSYCSHLSNDLRSWGYIIQYVMIAQKRIETKPAL